MRARDDGINTIMIVSRYDKRYRDQCLPWVNNQLRKWYENWGRRPPTERDFSGFDSNLYASLVGLPNIVIPSKPLPHRLYDIAATHQTYQTVSRPP